MIGSSSTFSRRKLLSMTVGATAAIAASPFVNLGRYQVFAATEKKYSKRAIELIERSLVLDMLSWPTPPDDPEKESDEKVTPDKRPVEWTDEWFEKLKNSGINVFHIANGGPSGANAYEIALTQYASYNGMIAQQGKRLMRVSNIKDLEEAHKGERIGCILGVQNSDHFVKLDDINQFYSLGQRVSQLTYNSRNLIGTGSTDRVDGGLSDYGIEVVERMNEVGMAVDVSHCGDRTTLDALEISKKPALITHSNVRALAGGHVRCKSDEIIRKMAAKGSVMGITSVRNFVRDREPTTIEHFLDHYDYIAKMVGIEHAGVGSDVGLYGYDYMSPEDLKAMKAYYSKGKYKFRDKVDVTEVAHPQRIFDLTDGLIRRGYSDADIEGVLGGNFKRVLKEIWV